MCQVVAGSRFYGKAGIIRDCFWCEALPRNELDSFRPTAVDEWQFILSAATICVFVIPNGCGESQDFSLRSK
ncbi:hypothetical protein DENIS_0941 [Desulfonema ishimotonii]|uniref:Uncharacterized protein n=1 Tax=Desulfonema ishimotonii TaxID=45657 RepID=A0A401FSQ3_9BACT|nr:hypothetical protein DENIS_0941 [Desulfonema ishimotonii]